MAIPKTYSIAYSTYSNSLPFSIDQSSQTN